MGRLRTAKRFVVRQIKYVIGYFKKERPPAGIESSRWASQRRGIKRLYQEWEKAVDAESDATSQAESAALALGAYGIDPNDPPAWVTGEPADEDWG